MSEQSKLDHYQQIALAVARLNRNTGEARRIIYDCIRAALIAQLHSANPPLSESDITRERLAFEATVRKVETESILRRIFAEISPGPTAGLAVANQTPSAATGATG
jgi:hypothetical protein